MKEELEPGIRDEKRFLSVDLFRGVVMFLLIAEATGLYELLVVPGFEGTFIQAIGRQFQHHPWNGLRLWDLGQPFFMFISGAAMFLSYTKRWKNGGRWGDSLLHAVKRSLILFALGWAIYRIVPVEDGSAGTFLYDMLPQLAVGGLVAFLILKRSVTTQIFVSFGLVALTELLYRLWAMLGHIQPFVAGDNFGSSVDRALLGSVSGEHWVAFNMVPFTSFVIWGALAGRLLRGASQDARKIRIMILLGLGGIVAGLSLTPVTPIVRRISTSSFILLSGGFCMLALALAFWLMDVVRIRCGAVIFLAIGMNPLFIYFFAQTGGADWLGLIAAPFSRVLGGWAGEWPAAFAAALMTQALLCGVCYGLYRRKIFIRI